MRGFTFIEMLVAIAVFTIIMGGISGFIVASYRSYGYIWQRALAIEEARRGVQIMVKEIREAKMGEDGSYPIATAKNNEFAFYSDIDKDDEVEKVRYFIGAIYPASQTKECVNYETGGVCRVTFSNFLSGELKSATVRISVEGDLGLQNREYADLTIDGLSFESLCYSGCSDCAGNWEGTTTLDVTEQAKDGVLDFAADGTWRVDNSCNWIQPNHSLKARFELNWTEERIDPGGEFKKGVIDPVGSPPQYPLDQEQISILSYYVRNVPPIFEYFDAAGNKIEEYPARLVDTKVMKVFLIVDVDPEHSPFPFELESSVQLRNLKRSYE